MTSANRKTPRFKCRLPIQVIIPNSALTLNGEIINIGLGGALLRIGGFLARTDLTFNVTLGAETFTLTAKLLRNQGQDPDDSRYALFGITFPLSGETHHHLVKIISRIRDGKS